LVDLVRSFLRERDMAQAVKDERELVVSELVLAGFSFAPIAVRSSQSLREYIDLRDLMHRRQPDSQYERISMIIRRRILRGIEEEERRAS
jgi:hypothetical protein